MVAGLVQEREDQGIVVHEGMESEAAINADDALAAEGKCLGVDDARPTVDFIVDPGERSPEIEDQRVQQTRTHLRAAESDGFWQGEGVQHLRIRRAAVTS